jgi:hypothetical protein
MNFDGKVTWTNENAVKRSVEAQNREWFVKVNEWNDVRITALFTCMFIG